MEIERAEGIVLRCQPVTETSLIVTWFTREFGRLKTMAKGARRPKSPFRGKLDLFYRDELLFLRSRRSDLHLLHECYLEDPHMALREGIERLAAASYVCELVELSVAVEDPNAKVFDLMAVALEGLGGRGNEALTIWFELQLLAAAGWAPRWEDTGGTSRVLQSLASASWTVAQRVQLSPLQLAEARFVLGGFWESQVGRRPRSARWMEKLEWCKSGVDMRRENR
jgi:DNA repair protein RecO (recombination protein O)